MAELRFEPRRMAALKCPYCLGVVLRPYAWACGRCGALHHDDCAEELGRCAIMGCAPAPRAPSEVRRSALAPALLFCLGVLGCLLLPFHLKVGNGLAGDLQGVVAIASFLQAFWYAPARRRGAAAWCVLVILALATGAAYALTLYVRRLQEAY